MTLVLDGVSKVVGATVHVHPTDLVLQKGTMNVLLGPTLAGKTTLMRLMAGLDVPNTGRILWNDDDVTGMRVQDRKVAMVYQQFINYPSMSVYENIASPMRLMGKDRAEIDRAVRATAELMKLTPFLDRKRFLFERALLALLQSHLLVMFGKLAFYFVKSHACRVELTRPPGALPQHHGAAPEEERDPVGHRPLRTPRPRHRHPDRRP